MDKIGVGIVTYKRPHLFSQAIRGIVTQLSDIVSYIGVYNDGSSLESYQDSYDSLPDYVEIIHDQKNHGVAYGKNVLLHRMMEEECDYLFLSEDDIVVVHPNAIHSYIEAYKDTGIEHLNFAHHGPCNKSGPVEESDGLAYYVFLVGAWSFYTRNAIEKAGYFDDNFINAWDHVEHTWRIHLQGLTRFDKYPDVKNSKDYISELCSEDKFESESVIRTTNNWTVNIDRGLRYWKAKDPRCPF